MSDRTDDSGMGDVRPLRPRNPRPPRGRRTRWQKWRLRILLAVIPLILVVASLLRFWVDLMWFDEIGQRSNLLTRMQWSVVIGLISGLFAFASLQLNMVIARRVAKADLYVPFLSPNAGPDMPEQVTIPYWVLRPIGLGVSLIVALFTGLAMSGRWETVLLWKGRSNFGTSDPQFHHDAAFYVFTVPFMEMIIHFLQVMVVLSGLAVIGAYLATGVIRYAPGPRIARSGIVHLSSLVASFLILAAFQYRISAWNLVFSTKGAATGAGWTDVHARIPAFWVMTVASIVLAVVIIMYARRERWQVVSGAVVTWIVVSIVATGVLPSIVQAVIVNPNEIDREQKVLKGNIDLTRKGFGLDKVKRQPYVDKASLSKADFAANTDTTDNIRLWSPDVLQRSLDQTQLFRNYYTFHNVDVDRYTVDGDLRQVMLAVRELDRNALPNESWTNRHLQYTHGYGAVAVWPNLATSQGQPELLLKDIPPRPVGQKKIDINRPEIYYGEQSNDWVISASRQKEFDYPDGEDNVYANYQGAGGVRVGGFLRRAAFAVSFSDPRLLVTGQITDKSRIMYHRSIVDRVTKLAPFLTLDRDPYPVVHDGRVIWIADAFTTSSRFPFSERSDVAGHSGINYVRNSVKATIDAYNGKVTLYINDTKDPVLIAWQSAFPGLFTSMDKMPADLREHVRYPEDLFNLQTNKWRRYHMGNARTFYSREDMWEFPTVENRSLESFFILARLPGEAREEMLLVRPMVPAGKRKNLIAYMAVRMDGDHYGEIRSLALPKQSLTQGPEQVQSLIKQDPTITDQVRQWRSGSDNTVIFGNMLVLPIEDSLLYVQPVYLENQGAKIPEFERVVVVLGDDIAWGNDFGEAVDELLRKKGAGDDTASSEPPTSKPDGDAATDTKGSDTDAPAVADDSFANLSDVELRRLVSEVNSTWQEAQTCQQQGDWTCYGQRVDKIQKLLADAEQRNK